MLVVTRKVGETIIIRAGSDTITISVETIHLEAMEKAEKEMNHGT